MNNKHIYIIRVIIDMITDTIRIFYRLNAKFYSYLKLKMKRVSKLAVHIR